MPDTLCATNGVCKITTDEETSVRLADMAADQSALRADAEDVQMTRVTTSTGAEWTGTNESGGAEHLIWTEADTGFSYTITLLDGAVIKSFGHCEVQ